MELSDYLSALRRRKWVIMLATMAVVSAAMVFSLLETPIYEARARVSIQPSQSVFSGSQAASFDPSSFLSTQMLILQSKPVTDLVRTKVGTAATVSAKQVGTTSVVEVSATNPRPTTAAETVNAYVDAYVSFRAKQEADSLGAQGQEIQTKVEGLQKQIDDLAGQLAGIGNCAGATPAPECARRDSLQRDRDSLVAQQVPFKQRLDELQIDRSVGGAMAQVITPAAAPTTPIRPTPVRNGILGLSLGLVLGVIAAFVFEYFDDSIKGKDELERFTPNLPVLGLIPTIPGWKDKKETYVVSLEDPRSPSSEAYRSLRTSIRFLALDKPLRTIQITSPNATEGKTTTISNLAVALAKSGERVVLLSCDFRRPRVHEFFGLSNAVGFTSVLLGEAPLSSALQRVNDTDPLWVLASGPLPPNPAELLSSTRVAETLSGLARFADTVLIDCPPMLPVTDAAIISARVDGTLLVVTAGTTTRKQVVRAVELLHQVGAPLVGSVLNNAPTEGAYGYVYYRYEQAHDNRLSKANGTKGSPIIEPKAGVPGPIA